MQDAEPRLHLAFCILHFACRAMAQGYRPDRVGEEIRQELSEMLSRGDIHDPGIGFITLTRVVVSPDLQQARVFYTSLGDEKARKETAKALGRATPYMRRQIGSRLRLRRVPELEFRFDQSIEHQHRVEQIIRDLHEHPPEPLDSARDSALEPTADVPTTPDDETRD
jgi:ribosome-binding factor A